MASTKCLRTHAHTHMHVQTQSRGDLVGESSRPLSLTPSSRDPSWGERGQAIKLFPGSDAIPVSFYPSIPPAHIFSLQLHHGAGGKARDHTGIAKPSQNNYPAKLGNSTLHLLLYPQQALRENGDYYLCIT